MSDSTALMRIQAILVTSLTVPIAASSVRG